MRSANNRRERGMTIVLLAVFLVALFAMAALAIDLGFAYTARTSAQHAADAAALAGAYTFTKTGLVQPDAAIDAAKGAAQANYVLGAPAVITNGDVNVSIPDRRVTVTVPRTGGSGISTVFARVLNIRSLDVVAQATAEALDAGVGSRCIKPIFLPNTILSSKDSLDAAGQPTAGTACGDGETIFDPSGAITAWADTQLGLCKGVRPTRPNDASLQTPLAPGQFYSLDFGAGASAYRCTWGACLNQCPQADQSIIECGNLYPLKTGDMVGPTGQGVGDLIGNPADTWSTNWTTTNQVYVDQPSGTSVADSASLVVAPVWDNCVPPGIKSGTAGQQVAVIGFMMLFVDGQGNPAPTGCPSGSGKGKGKGGGPGAADMVYAHVISFTECGATGGGGSPGNVSGPGGRPIRLIQTP